MMNRKKIRIFVEGKNEEPFLKAYIGKIFKQISVEIEYIPTNGYTGLKKVENQFKENTDFGGLNLVLFDADSSENDGGFKKRKTEIEKIKKDLDVNFKLFLFPNNKSDGDFETLLENIINSKHFILLKCFEEYENCISKKTVKGKNIYNLPNRKSKIYSYINAFPKSKNEEKLLKKDKNFLYDNSEYWNLDNKYLEPLKTFLKDTINQFLKKYL